MALAGRAQLSGALSSKLEGCGFSSQSGHRPRLHVHSPWLGHVLDSNQLMSLSLSLPLPFLLKTMKKCPGVRIKKRERMNIRQIHALSDVSLIFVTVNLTCRWDINVEITKQSFGSKCMELRESDKIYVVWKPLSKSCLNN